MLGGVFLEGCVVVDVERHWSILEFANRILYGVQLDCVLFPQNSCDQQQYRFHVEGSYLIVVVWCGMVWWQPIAAPILWHVLCT